MGLRPAEGTRRGGSMRRGRPSSPRLGDRLAGLRGRITPDAEMDKITWFRAGGTGRGAVPAGRRGRPRRLPQGRARSTFPLTVVGIGSNLLVREGGIPRLRGPPVGQGLRRSRRPSPRHASAPARPRPTSAGRGAGAGGRHRRLPFLPWHPRRHRRRPADECRSQWRRDARAGCRGARARPAGRPASRFRNADMGYAYRHSSAPADLIFTSARASRAIRRTGRPIKAAMDAVQHHRETVQPIREKTGGSTFKNPKAPRPGRRSTRPAAAA